MAGGVGIYGIRMTGIFVSPGMIEGDNVRGLALAGAYSRFRALDGLTSGAFCKITERQSGVSIGIVNHARRLNGVQIGLINHAANNGRWLRWLPILNMHFE